MPFSIVRQDITQMAVDAIVNAANTDLLAGGGVCGAIFKAAGAKEMQAACDNVAPIKTGGAAITPGYALKAKYVIHAAGPIYSQWSAEQNEQYLRSAYTESLKLAEQHKCESIAFPLISSGIYGYPKDQALKVATKAIRDFLMQSDTNVYLTVFDKEAFQVSRELLGSIESYIDENYVRAHRSRRRELSDSSAYSIESNDRPCPIKDCAPQSVEELLGKLDEPFSVMLLRLIDEKQKTDVAVYKKANIDRKLFSKIRTEKGYMPSKRTILALAIALELSVQEADALLERAGYTLSHSQKLDVIVEYFLTCKKYDIYEINEVLYQYDQQSLGGGRCE